MTEVESIGKKKRIGSRFARAIVFLLLSVSSFVASVSILCSGFALTKDFYGTGTAQDSATDMRLGYYTCRNAANTMWDYVQQQDMDGAERYFSSKNYDVSILFITAGPAGQERKEDIIFGTYDGLYEASMTQDFYFTSDEGLRWYSSSDGKYKYIRQGGTYLVRVYVNSKFPYHDGLRLFVKFTELVYQMRYTFIWIAIAGCIGTILCFLFLIHSVDHDNWKDSSQTKKGYGVYLDLQLALFLLGMAGILIGADRALSLLSDWDIVLEMLAAAVFMMVIVVIVALFCYNMARGIKYGKWWTHTLIYTSIRYFLGLLKLLGQSCVHFLGGIPLVMFTVCVYLSVCLLEFLGGFFFLEARIDMLWILDKLILFPVVIYLALCCKRFLAASKALAGGQLDHTVNTSGMIGEMKMHGENLNHIGQGITKAVEARTKSERLKTELITNVTHDLKTPLTSIINYSRLISEQKTENKEIAEYSQVLLRQSERLKKLLEDLLEASKATTGNLEVNLMPCEVGVILSQAVGEYQHRLEEKELELHITQPEEPVRIMADGRHLWRIFDNLLNNICKYSQEKSRVYLNVEQSEGRVFIIFRNMSKYVLNVSAEELGERFVRGDKSRHMEGNGLGLSIAKNLLELQNGTMQILIDGDLFKVTLNFKALDEKQN